MKIPGKKAIALSIATLVIVPGMAFATISLVKPKAEVKTAEPVQQVAVVEKQEAVAEPVAEEVPAETAPVETTPVVEPVAAPVVLSTQEYAEKWLDMDSYHAQLCLDRIVALWPQRFTEDVRERNIKALRAYAVVCSTGIDDARYNDALRAGHNDIENTSIGRYGVNGEFFDSLMAQRYWN